MTSSTCSPPSCFMDRRLLVGLHFLSFTLLYMPTGLAWYFGNIAVYLNSYWYEQHGSAGILTEWVISTYIVSWSLGFIIGGIYIKKIDRRLVTVIGVAFFDTGVFTSYWSVQYSRPLFLVTYGVITGLGIGFQQAEIITRIPKLVAKRTGLAFAALDSSLSLGAVIYNPVITWYVNPSNKQPTLLVDSGRLNIFIETSLTNRVPFLFIVLGFLTSLLHFTGFGLSVLLHEKGEIQSNTKTTSFEKGGESIEVQEFTSQPEPKDIHIESERRGKPDSKAVISAQDMDRYLESCFDYNSISSDNKNLLPKRYLDKTETPDLKVGNRKDAYYGDLNPFEIIKILTFYLLWFSLMATGISYIVLLNFYKVFGELWIQDDHFLTQLGMAFVITVFVTRVVWAFILDRYEIKTAQIILNSCLSVTFLFYYFSPQIDQWLFGVITCVMATLCSAVYIVFPVLSLKLFGPTHIATNYGLVMTSTILLNLVAPPIARAVLHHFGWSVIFIGTGAINVLSLVANILWLPDRH